MKVEMLENSENYESGSAVCFIWEQGWYLPPILAASNKSNPKFLIEGKILGEMPRQIGDRGSLPKTLGKFFENCSLT